MSKELIKLMKRNPALFDEYRAFVVKVVLSSEKRNAAKAAAKGTF